MAPVINDVTRYADATSVKMSPISPCVTENCFHLVNLLFSFLIQVYRILEEQLQYCESKGSTTLFRKHRADCLEKINKESFTTELTE